MKLVFSPICLMNSLSKTQDLFRVYNFGTMIVGIDYLQNLLPLNLSTYDEYQFDIEYANYIIQNDSAFLDLMKIMIPLYEGENILILTNMSNPYYEMITESLIKFINSFYGVISYIVNEEEDLMYIRDSSFSIDGIQRLDNDRKRYLSLVYKYGIKETL